MANKQPKNKHILRNILLSLAVIPVIFILIIVTSLIVTPILESIDKTKFERLDTKSQALFEHIKHASGGKETWIYDAHCTEQRSGPWPTGKYQCSTTMSLALKVTSVAAFVDLHEKYYPVINSASMLTPAGDLQKEYPNDFGINFVVSSAEKNYTIDVDKAFKCRYLASIDQSEGNDIRYGIDIANGVGLVNISFECTDLARGNWYEQH